MAEDAPVIEKAYAIFSEENKMMPVGNIVRSLRCAGFVIDDDFGSDFTAETHIGFEEYRVLAQKAAKQGMTREKIEECFRFYDPKDTGYIRAYDFRKILSTGENSLAESDIQTIFDQFPPNDEGMVCYNLLIQYLFED